MANGLCRQLDDSLVIISYGLFMNPDDPSTPHVSRQRFKRYHRAAERRRAAERQDSQFFRAVFSLAGVAGALAIGLAVFGMTGGNFDPSTMERLLEPWIGSLSRLQVGGLVFVIIIGGLYFWRIRKR